MQELGYLGPVTAYPGITGHKFDRGGPQRWVLWSFDENPYYISLPPGVTGLFDTVGAEIDIPATGELIIDRPIYLDIEPGD